MIIGNGLLASEFAIFSGEYDDYLVFASGVSNSKETDPIEFKREEDLIVKTLSENNDLTFIYFSSILATIGDNRYYSHKLRIEQLIHEYSNNYIIFRIPQIIGAKGNQMNLVNFLKNCIKSDIDISIYNGAIRSLIDVSDLVSIVNICKGSVRNEIINFAYIEKILVSELCNKIGIILDKSPRVKFCDNINNYNCDILNSGIIDLSLKKLMIDEKGYTDKIIRKYIK